MPLESQAPAPPSLCKRNAAKATTMSAQQRASLDYSKFDIVDSDEEAIAPAWEAAKKASAAAKARLDAESAVEAAKTMARAPTRTVVGPEPEGGPSNPFDFDLDNALKLLEKAEAGVCESFLEALSTQLFNAPLRKAAAGEAGALAAIVGTLTRHPGHAGVAAKGCRAMRHLCFGNALNCASAEACGAVSAIAVALTVHDTGDVRHEGVWALTVLCNSSETALRAASRTCFDRLTAIAGDLEASGAQTSAMAMFLVEKVGEWRCGGNR